MNNNCDRNTFKNVHAGQSIRDRKRKQVLEEPRFLLRSGKKQTTLKEYYHDNFKSSKENMTLLSNTDSNNSYSSKLSCIKKSVEQISHMSLSENCKKCSSVVDIDRTFNLPPMTWANSKEVWESLLQKDSLKTRDPLLFRNHPSLQPRMRSILLDWLIEVCEVYRLHRETYHMALDFIDRFLSKTPGVAKQKLQLIGVTCLFISSKIEEIFPPKLGEFAFITDGACTEEEILETELVIMKTLDWKLSPLTTNFWLGIYLQLCAYHSQEFKENNSSDYLVFPCFLKTDLVKAAQIIDLAMLDVTSLHFLYSHIAAASLYFSVKDLALQVSGYTLSDLTSCINWLKPFIQTLEDIPFEMKDFPNIPPDDYHNIQTHCIDLNLLEVAQEKMKKCKQLFNTPDAFKVVSNDKNSVSQFEMLTAPPNNERHK